MFEEKDKEQQKLFSNQQWISLVHNGTLAVIMLVNNFESRFDGLLIIRLALRAVQSGQQFPQRAYAVDLIETSPLLLPPTLPPPFSRFLSRHLSFLNLSDNFALFFLFNLHITDHCWDIDLVASVSNAISASSVTLPWFTALRQLRYQLFNASQVEPAVPDRRSGIQRRAIWPAACRAFPTDVHFSRLLGKEPPPSRETSCKH
ncbi:hypothetical protein Tsp_01595 [Trichinella spiralis]|uniref:Uncharacterized protein n=1 Tax=Trichinella spiralis TaxID=6334 RepID=E5SCY2_TRISP|nr:hypothetical protein Tsp_01595 [Trichinella spiralis]KRY37915.1 hypothetical protein T01_12791 [Trichinella spiralis]